MVLIKKRWMIKSPVTRCVSIAFITQYIFDTINAQVQRSSRIPVYPVDLFQLLLRKQIIIYTQRYGPR
jgi:hypothetical protein